MTSACVAAMSPVPSGKQPALSRNSRHQVIGRGTAKLTRTTLPKPMPDMIRRRAEATGIKTKIGNHSFRVPGITAYLNGGTGEKAAALANHASTRTAQLYDGRRDEMSLDEVERIII